MSSVSVSIVMACLNPAGFLQDAVQSCLGQRGVDVELIVVDDGSSDGSREWLEAYSREEPRLKLLNGPGTGPAAARNLAISAARGDWVAVMDADDIIHPDRLARLVAIATTHKVEIVADQLLAFTENEDGRLAWPFIADLLNASLTEVSLPVLVTPTDGGFGSALGYVKPVIRMDFLKESGVVYDTTVRIGEDFDFLANLLAHGARLLVSSLPLYFYRRHPTSLSFRLNSNDADALIAANTRFLQKYETRRPDIRSLLLPRDNALRRYRAAVRLVEHIKRIRPLSALSALCQRPSCAIIFAGFVFEGLQRRFGRNRVSLSPFPKGQVGISSERLRQLTPDELDTDSLLQVAIPLTEADEATKKRLSLEIKETFWAGFAF